MKYALIIDGVVTQVQPNEETGFIEVDDDVVCGMIDNGLGIFAIPPKTADELVEIAKEEASRLRDQAMLTGVDYQGSMISLTDVDGNGMLQVKAAFEMGLPATTIHFKNDTKLPMAAADFPAFALWFVTERNRFFV